MPIIGGSSHNYYRAPVSDAGVTANFNDANVFNPAEEIGVLLALSKKMDNASKLELYGKLSNILLEECRNSDDPNLEPKDTEIGQFIQTAYKVRTQETTDFMHRSNWRFNNRSCACEPSTIEDIIEILAAMAENKDFRENACAQTNSPEDCHTNALENLHKLHLALKLHKCENTLAFYQSSKELAASFLVARFIDKKFSQSDDPAAKMIAKEGNEISRFLLNKLRDYYKLSGIKDDGHRRYIENKLLQTRGYAGDISQCEKDCKNFIDIYLNKEIENILNDSEDWKIYIENRHQKLYLKFTEICTMAMEDLFSLEDLVQEGFLNDKSKLIALKQSEIKKCVTKCITHAAIDSAIKVEKLESDRDVLTEILEFIQPAWHDDIGMPSMMIAKGVSDLSQFPELKKIIEESKTEIEKMNLTAQLKAKVDKEEADIARKTFIDKDLPMLNSTKQVIDNMSEEEQLEYVMALSKNDYSHGEITAENIDLKYEKELELAIKASLEESKNNSQAGDMNDYFDKNRPISAAPHFTAVPVVPNTQADPVVSQLSSIAVNRTKKQNKEKIEDIKRNLIKSITLGELMDSDNNENYREFVELIKKTSQEINELTKNSCEINLVLQLYTGLFFCFLLLLKQDKLDLRDILLIFCEDKCSQFLLNTIFTYTLLFEFNDLASKNIMARLVSGFSGILTIAVNECDDLDRLFVYLGYLGINKDFVTPQVPV